MSTKNTPFWQPEDLISVYTRKDAIEDGILIDVTEMAKQAGFKFPVAISAKVHAMIEQKPRLQDYKGRLWDLLFMASLAARRSPGSRIVFKVLMQVGKSKMQTFQAIIGPGDTAAPVITIFEISESTD